MKSIVKFLSVKIKDFKSIEDLSLNLKKLNDIYGKNQTGKSSVLEAIHFACRGGKNDTDKIRVGAEKAVVEIEAEKSGVPIYIKTTLKKNGVLSCTAKKKGVRHNEPRSLIKELLSFGTFNPREILDKHGRLGRLLQLIPIFIKKEDLTINGVTFPVTDSRALKFNEHAFVVLQALDKDLRNNRLTKGREKDIFLKAYQKRKDDLDNSIITFKQNYETSPFKEEQKGLEETIREHENIKDELSRSKVGLADCITDKNLRGSKLEAEQERIETIKSGIQIKKEQINKLQLAIKEDEKAMLLSEREAQNLKDAVQEYEKKEKKFTTAIEDLSPKAHKFETEISKARQVSRIKQTQEELKGQKIEADQKEADWKKIDDLIKVHFPALQTKVLSPIQTKIPGIEIKDGDLLYNGISVNTLSGSEVVQLSLKLMALQENANLLFINEMECCDSDSISKINFDDFSNVIVARVADTPLGKPWNSIEMKK